MKTVIQFLFFVCLAQLGYGQVKTRAFFRVGDYASSDWEKLAFDLTSNGPRLTYSYRTNERGHLLRPLGTRLVGGKKALLVSMPGTARRYVILPDQVTKRVLMTSEDGTYRKVFLLGYEGPVDGQGTYCATCANEPADAFRLVSRFIP